MRALSRQIAEVASAILVISGFEYVMMILLSMSIFLAGKLFRCARHEQAWQCL